MPWPVRPGHGARDLGQRDTARRRRVARSWASQVRGSSLGWSRRAAAAERILARSWQGGAVQGEPGDDDARGPERAGVVPGHVGVGLPDHDAVDRGAERLRDQLAVHGRGAVAELGGPDAGLVPAVVEQADRRLGVVPARGDGGDHGDGHPGADEGAGRARAGRPSGRPGPPPRGPGTGPCRRSACRGRPPRRGRPPAAGRRARRRCAGAASNAEIPTDRARSSIADSMAKMTCPSPYPRNAPDGQRVGVDGLGVDPLVGAPVHRDRLADAVEHDAGPVVAVGAGVGQDVDAHRGQHAVGVGTQLDLDADRVPAGHDRELVGTRHLVLHRAAGAQDGERDDVLGEQLLLAAEPAADAAGEHPDLRGVEREDVRDLVADQVRHLGAGAQDEPAVLVEPAAGRVRLQRRRATRGSCGTCRRRGAPRRRGPPRRSPSRRAAARRRCGPARRCAPRDPCRRAPGARRAPAPRSGSTTAGSTSYSTSISAQRPRRLAQRLGDDDGDPLPVEPQDRVEHAGVVGVVEAALVAGGREQGGGGVLVREDGQHAGGAPGRRWCRSTTIRAWACGLPRTARWARSVAGTSSVNGSRPVTIRRAAGERTDRPASWPATGSTVLRRPATASQIDRYPVQRQRLPLSRRAVSSSSASSPSPATVVTSPAVQNPHWNAAASTNACCTGCGSRRPGRPS